MIDFFSTLKENELLRKEKAELERENKALKQAIYKLVMDNERLQQKEEVAV